MRDLLLAQKPSVVVATGPPVTDPTEKWRQAHVDMQNELLKSGVLDDESLRALRGDPDVATTRAWVSRQAQQVIVADTPHGRFYPIFQFTAVGDLRAELAPHIVTLQGAGYSPWVTWDWLVNRATLLSGDIPAQVLVDNPARGVGAVQVRAVAAPRADREG